MANITLAQKMLIGGRRVPVPPTWIAALSGPTTSSDLAMAIATDADGNHYIQGRLASSSPTKMCIAKYNSSGALQWQRELYQIDRAFANGIGVDSVGNVYVLGHGRDSGSYDHAIIAKYNSSGALQWQRKLSQTNKRFSSEGIAVSPSGDVAIVIANETDSPKSSTVAKYNNAGTLQWQRTVSHSTGVTLLGCAIDVSDNVYACGSFDGSSRSYGLLRKYNSSGALQAERRIYKTDSSGNYAVLRGVAVDGSGNIYLAAQMATGSVAYATGIKLNSSFVIQWDRHVTGSGAPSSWDGVAISPDDGSVVFCGDGAAVQYLPDASVQWQRNLIGETGDNLTAVSCTDDAVVFAALMGFTASGNDMTTVKMLSGGGVLGMYGPMEWAELSFSSTALTLTIDTPTLTDSAGALTDAAGNAADAAGSLTPTLYEA